MKKQVILFLFNIIHLNLFAQPPIQWQKCLGGSNSELASCIQQTTDGGYILTGYAKSNDGDVIGIHGFNLYRDAWVVKLNNLGNIQWQKCYGGTAEDMASSIQQTTDGGYILSGTTQSTDGDVIGYNGAVDIWVVKLDISGSIVWQKCLGGTNGESSGSIQQTIDGGYILSGFSASNDGDVIGNHGNGDAIAVSDENEEESKTIEEEMPKTIRVFPNPNAGSFTFEYQTTEEGIGELQIVNVMGQSIYNTTVNVSGGLYQQQIELGDNFPKGIYIVRFILNGKQHDRKLVLQ